MIRGVAALAGLAPAMPTSEIARIDTTAAFKVFPKLTIFPNDQIIRLNVLSKNDARPVKADNIRYVQSCMDITGYLLNAWFKVIGIFAL